MRSQCLLRTILLLRWIGKLSWGQFDWVFPLTALVFSFDMTGCCLFSSNLLLALAIDAVPLIQPHHWTSADALHGLVFLQRLLLHRWHLCSCGIILGQKMKHAQNSFAPSGVLTLQAVQSVFISAAPRHSMTMLHAHFTSDKWTSHQLSETSDSAFPLLSCNTMWCSNEPADEQPASCSLQPHSWGMPTRCFLSQRSLQDVAIDEAP